MTAKILMSEHAQRVLIDWTITLDDGRSIDGAWGFEKSRYRDHSLWQMARQELYRFIGEKWECSDEDIGCLAAQAHYQFAPRRPIKDVP